MTQFNKAFKSHKAHFGPMSKGLIDYVENHVLLNSRYLFTQSSVGIQFAYCTHCRERHRPETPLKHNDHADCPKCKSVCIVKKSHVGRKYLIDQAYVMYYEKSILDPSIMTAVGFYVRRDYTGDYKDVQTLYRPSCSYVFEMGKSEMFYTSYYNHDKWYQSKTIKSEYSVYKNRMQCHYSRDNIAAAVKGTPFQFSTWEHYDEQDMTKFFGMYSKYPCIEYLTKMDYEYFVLAKLYGTRTFDAIKWSGKSVEKVLKLSKKDLRQFREYAPQISWADDEEALTLRLYQITLKDNNRPTLAELRKIAYEIRGFFPQMKPMLKFQNLRACVSYINKQYRSGKQKHYYAKESMISMWHDYMKQCKVLGFDTTRQEIVFPHNLYTAHASATSQIEIKLSREEAEKIAKRAELLEKYRFSYDGYVIRPAISGNEIIEEGKVLRHCVGGYAKDHADGKTNILLIRKIADLDTPYFTMELKEGKITQTYGYRHLLPKGDLLKLLDAFKEQKINRKTRKKISANRQEVAI